MPSVNAGRAARTIKGAANPRRVSMLFLLAESPDLSVNELADKLDINFRTASEHTKKLAASGLVKKTYNHNFVTHQLTPLGEKMLIAIEELSG